MLLRFSQGHDNQYGRRSQISRACVTSCSLVIVLPSSQRQSDQHGRRGRTARACMTSFALEQRARHALRPRWRSAYLGYRRVLTRFPADTVTCRQKVLVHRIQREKAKPLRRRMFVCNRMDSQTRWFDQTRQNKSGRPTIQQSPRSKMASRAIWRLLLSFASQPSRSTSTVHVR